MVSYNYCVPPCKFPRLLERINTSFHKRRNTTYGDKDKAAGNNNKDKKIDTYQ